MAKYVYDFSEGNKDLKDLLGGKGANLAEMTRLGLPVPPGFTITTEACRAYMADGQLPPDLRVEVTMAVRRLEDELGRGLGDFHDPLLVSVRSGAKFSMPGMMETVLNIGLNDASVQGLAKFSDDERFAWDSYRRLIQMFGKTVLDIDGERFSGALEQMKDVRGVTADTDLTADDLRELVGWFKQIVHEESGREFPQHPREQLDLAITAVFNSWNTERARLYRRRERIPHDLGTAVNVVSMVFGNLGPSSGTGVCFTRDPSTGHSGVYGDYLPNAQGEDVVAGIRNTLTLADLETLDPTSYAELRQAMRRLETHYRDLCDIEFTIERGKLWMLQTRVGKRTAAAAFRIATQLVDEHLITMDEALERVSGQQLSKLMFPQFDSGAERTLLATGMAASPGAAVGMAVFDSATAQAWAAEGKDVVLVRRETNPDDLGGMIAAVGVLTSRGGKTSHAAVVARGMGTTCVVGAEKLDVDVVAREMRVGKKVVREGDVIAIDGSSGEIFLGAVPVVPSPVVQYLEDGLDVALEHAADDDTRELVKAVDRVLTHADTVRRLRVHANADTPGDAHRARVWGAQGIGLCRTEHMFLGERRVLIERLILAREDAERQAALDALLPLQRADFTEILREMDGRPTTIRLIDPPLHEFLPDLTELSVKVALAAERGETGEVVDRDRDLLAAVQRMHEANPMLGLRGVRLGIVVPGLFALQIRAVAEAAAARLKEGGRPHAEIMVPLAASVMELHLVRDEAERILADVAAEQGVELHVPIGAMIELPRAALTADRMAQAAEFFSFGTNDLTQTTWGFSRDDVEGAFFTEYTERGVISVSPFETIDRRGVGRLVRIAVEEGRRERPDIVLGVCGEHGGDPESVHFFHEVGLDYVSCSPFRVPIARLEAGRAAVVTSGSDTR
ncbi:pyruvate, phosphate dikinase [Cellulomonas carbonis]|uniref:Pyruvate, phosphate dikinase n=1 Tax=Cellulomonas carbonis T26 TaxID=947969 RepID=A0A0A0BR93_9CELL|nr:pyruvate, phosphate dikinase [Cellulomonas carbonis]KGM10475.1 pyruvate phosphate dikinase [Cellulomonas carbonis T26]GGC04704.1 pyruvate, phosphate dikinase [Cellulomonas carbonis]